jgi:ssDNA-binding Zn-finger/Zn-ribbon topoisomerase 1
VCQRKIPKGNKQEHKLSKAENTRPKNHKRSREVVAIKKIPKGNKQEHKLSKAENTRPKNHKRSREVVAIK